MAGQIVLNNMKYRIIHDASFENSVLPIYWSDDLCNELVAKIGVLHMCGNVIRIHYCCDLDAGIKYGDYALIRRWIASHDHMVRRVLCYFVYMA